MFTSATEANCTFALDSVSVRFLCRFRKVRIYAVETKNLVQEVFIVPDVSSSCTCSRRHIEFSNNTWRRWGVAAKGAKKELMRIALWGRYFRAMFF